jgi:DNA-binding MarR family transcriptional regulator
VRQDANPPYRFGDLLALARRAWTLRMARELSERGYPGYHITDAATVRTLLAGPAPVGAFASVLGVTRQAARKVARRLEQRGYATAERNAADGRSVNIALTHSGIAYAEAVIEVIGQLNREIAEAVTPDQLVAADAVLRAALDNDPQMKLVAERVAAPQRPTRPDRGPTR